MKELTQKFLEVIAAPIENDKEDKFLTDAIEMFEKMVQEGKIEKRKNSLVENIKDYKKESNVIFYGV